MWSRKIFRSTPNSQSPKLLPTPKPQNCSQLPTLIPHPDFSFDSQLSAPKIVRKLNSPAPKIIELPTPTPHPCII